MKRRLIYVDEAPAMVASFYAPAGKGFAAGQELVVQALTGWYCFKSVEQVCDLGNGWHRVFLL